MGVIHSCVVNTGLVIAEPINNSIQEWIDKADRDTLLLIAKHGEKKNISLIVLNYFFSYDTIN